MPHRAVVVYDGHCPICRREIAHYQRREGAQNLRWIDAQTNLPELLLLGISRERALAIMHVRDPQGQWHLGVDAFLVLWAQLPAYRWLAWVVSRLGLKPLLSWGYQRFLKWRSKQNCDENRCVRR